MNIVGFPILDKQVCAFFFQMTAEEFGKQDFARAKDFALYFEVEQKDIFEFNTTDIKRLTLDILTFEEFVRQNTDAFITMFQELE